MEFLADYLCPSILPKVLNLRKVRTLIPNRQLRDWAAGDYRLSNGSVDDDVVGACRKFAPNERVGSHRHARANDVRFKHEGGFCLIPLENGDLALRANP